MSLRALSALERLGSAWVVWRGGPCPLAAAALVLTLLRDGTERRGQAGEWCWTHDVAPDGWEPDDIVAFRAAA